jgi:hypothetical protein
LLLSEAQRFVLSTAYTFIMKEVLQIAVYRAILKSTQKETVPIKQGDDFAKSSLPPRNILTYKRREKSVYGKYLNHRANRSGGSRFAGTGRSYHYMDEDPHAGGAC